LRREHIEALEGKNYHVYAPEHLVHNKVYGFSMRYRGCGEHNIPYPEKYVMLPENREWKVPFKRDRGTWDVSTPQELLTILQLLEDAYKVPMLWSPSHVGWERFKSTVRGGIETIHPLHETQRQEFTILARRMPGPIGYAFLHTQEGYIHGIDKNAQFLGAAQSVMLGNGKYLEMDDSTNFQGFYEYTITDTSEESIIGGWFPREGIASLDLLLAMMQSGLTLQVGKGICWPESKKYLNTWAIDMWNIRHQFTDQATLAGIMGSADQQKILEQCASTAKMVPNSMVGMFVHKGLPHWNRLIVHRAIANQLRSIGRLYRDENMVPVLVCRDSLYYVSDEPDPYKALPSMLEHEHEQRGYKLIGTCKITDDIRHAFTRATDRRFGVGGVEGVIRKEMEHVR